MLGKNSPKRQRQLFHYFRQMSFECFGIQPVLFDANRTQLENNFFQIGSGGEFCEVFASTDDVDERLWNNFRINSDLFG